MSSLIQTLSLILVTVIGLTHKITHTYWLDIILLTFVVRIILGPLNKEQTRTMKMMSELQPKMKEIQEKYKDDAMEQQKQMGKLYQKHNIKWYMGCLPMLIQMPILISFFYVLRIPKYYKLLPGFEQSSFLGARLTVKAFESSPFPDIESLPGMLDLGNLFNVGFFMDKFLYLPALPLLALYMATTVFQTRMMQSRNPQAQSSQMNFMLPLMLYFGFIFPVGVLVYWGLSSLFQLQQYMAMDKSGAMQLNSDDDEEKKEGGEEASPPPPPPPKKRKKKRKRKN